MNNPGGQPQPFYYPQQQQQQQPQPHQQQVPYQPPPQQQQHAPPPYPLPPYMPAPPSGPPPVWPPQQHHQQQQLPHQHQQAPLASSPYDPKQSQHLAYPPQQQPAPMYGGGRVPPTDNNYMPAAPQAQPFAATEAYDPDEPNLDLPTSGSSAGGSRRGIDAGTAAGAVRVLDDDHRGWFGEAVTPPPPPPPIPPPHQQQQLQQQQPQGGGHLGDMRGGGWHQNHQPQPSYIDDRGGRGGGDGEGGGGGRSLPSSRGGGGPPSSSANASKRGRPYDEGRSPPSERGGGGGGRGRSQRSRRSPPPVTGGAPPRRVASDPRYPGPRGDRYSPDEAGAIEPSGRRPGGGGGGAPPPSSATDPRRQQQHSPPSGPFQQPPPHEHVGSRGLRGGPPPAAGSPRGGPPRKGFPPSSMEGAADAATAVSPPPPPPPGGAAGGVVVNEPAPFVYSPKQLGICDLEVRFPGIYIPSDFTSLVNNWVELNTLKDGTIATCLLGGSPTLRLKVDSSQPSGQQQPSSASAETGSLDRRYNVRVILCKGPDPSLDEPSLSGDIFRHIHLLVGRRKSKGGHLLLPGGAWMPSLDGTNPDADDNVLIRAAKRTVLQFCNLDLSRCSRWKRLASIHYHRPEEVVQGKQYPEQEEVTVIYLAELSGATQGRVTGSGGGGGLGMGAGGGLSHLKDGNRGVEMAVDMFLDTMEESVLRMLLETKTRSSTSNVDGLEVRRRLKVVLLQEGGNKMQQQQQQQGGGGGGGEDADGSTTTLVACAPGVSEDQKDKAVSLEIRSLSDLLTYSQQDRNERHFEVSITAEMLVCLINRHHGSLVFHAIKGETVYELGGPPVKLQPVPNEDAHLLTGQGLGKLLSMYITDQSSSAGASQAGAEGNSRRRLMSAAEEDTLGLYLACRCFDRQGAGQIPMHHLERILQNLGVSNLSRKDIGKLVERIMVDPASPAAITSSGPATTASFFPYLSVLRTRLQRILRRAPR